ncbi:MAG: tetratricopeptide repeat protein [Candidatus Zixiibacteriota bacterium]
MQKHSGLILVLVLCLAATTLADYRKLNKKGNEAYSKNDIEQALKLYQEAEIEKPQQPVLDYNIATALYGQAKYEDAVKRYAKSLQTDDPALQSDAYYNMGASFFRNEKYAEAITAFQKGLELNPDDRDAKYNLELSRKKLKEQAQNQQQQNQDQQQQDKQEQQQEQQNDQQQQQQGEGDQEKKDQQEQGQKDEQGEQEQQQQQQDEGKQDQQQQQQQGGEGDQDKQQAQQEQGQGDDQKMSKEDAQRILQAIGNDEKDLQKKINRTKVKFGSYKSTKDW